ncbi:hypothetical protein [Methanobrevibacter sp.]|uniref:hypothetical protein n=1 Tax=Methanobrevibacter sp. TaxID=66852 RepID=UPI0038910275
MNMDKKIIIAGIAVVVIILAGIMIIAPNNQNQNQTAYEIPLKTQAFNFFDMETPVDSNFTIKTNQSENSKGMIAWQNKGNFSKDIDLIIISKNFTDRLIPDKMKLISDSNSQKIYMSENYDGNYYRIVKTVNDTDIILSGHNLDLLEKMINTTKVKDTSKITFGQGVEKTQANNTTDNKTAGNNTTVKKTVNNNTTVKKTEDKTPVQKVIEKKSEDDKKPDDTSKPETTIQKSIDPIMIGGGSFTTGSADEDKTYARLYIGADHAGEDVGIKIFYSRDGTSLNHGNYVPATIKSDGYVEIASADAYSRYPDFAKVELYDADGNLVATQGIHLNPTSGTQYF